MRLVVVTRVLNSRLASPQTLLGDFARRDMGECIQFDELQQAVPVEVAKNLSGKRYS